MYSQLNAEMVRANQAELARAASRAGHRQDVQEPGIRAARGRKLIGRIAAAAAGLMPIGGASDALAATSVHGVAGRHFLKNV